MSEQPSHPAAPLVLSNPKIVAAALAAGGRLARVEEIVGRRLAFYLSELPSDFLQQLTNDKVLVSARSMVSAMETILSMIAEKQQARRR